MSLPATRLLAIAVPEGWQAWCIPVSGFSIPPQESARLQKIVSHIRVGLISSLHLNHEAFIQLEQFEENDARAVFAKHARDWIPEIGLGVWPDRDPPAVWTREEFRSAPPGERIRPLMFNVFQISMGESARREAIDLLFGFGSMLEILTVEKAKALFELMNAVLLPPIKDPSYTCFPFYVPLLDIRSITGRTGAQLDQWCNGINVYIRQSFEDKGVLILSRESLFPMFETMGAIPEGDRKNSWLIPWT